MKKLAQISEHIIISYLQLLSTHTWVPSQSLSLLQSLFVFFIFTFITLTNIFISSHTFGIFVILALYLLMILRLFVFKQKSVQHDVIVFLFSVLVLFRSDYRILLFAFLWLIVVKIFLDSSSKSYLESYTSMYYLLPYVAFSVVVKGPLHLIYLPVTSIAILNIIVLYHFYHTNSLKLSNLKYLFSGDDFSLGSILPDQIKADTKVWVEHKFNKLPPTLKKAGPLICFVGICFVGANNFINNRRETYKLLYDTNLSSLTSKKLRLHQILEGEKELSQTITTLNKNILDLEREVHPTLLMKQISKELLQEKSEILHHKNELKIEALQIKYELPEIQARVNLCEQGTHEPIMTTIKYPFGIPFHPNLRTVSEEPVLSESVFDLFSNFS